MPRHEFLLKREEVLVIVLGQRQGRNLPCRCCSPNLLRLANRKGMFFKHRTRNVEMFLDLVKGM